MIIRGKSSTECDFEMSGRRRNARGQRKIKRADWDGGTREFDCRWFMIHSLKGSPPRSWRACIMASHMGPFVSTSGRSIFRASAIPRAFLVYASPPLNFCGATVSHDVLPRSLYPTTMKMTSIATAIVRKKRLDWRDRGPCKRHRRYRRHRSYIEDTARIEEYTAKAT